MGRPGRATLPRSRAIADTVTYNNSRARENRMRFLSALMPREARFFALFDRHAELIAEGGRANSELVRTYADQVQRAALIARIGELERAADKITYETVQLLHSTFITPFDRNDIHRLISGMDDILDLIQDSAESMHLFDIQTLPPAAPFFKQGRLRPIALLSAERSPSAPDIPTVRESGIPELKDFSLESYYGFMAPPGTPAAVASKIEADVLKVAAQPELKKKLESAGMDMLVLNGAAMTRLIRADLEKYSRAAKAANIRAE